MPASRRGATFSSWWKCECEPDVDFNLFWLKETRRAIVVIISHGGPVTYTGKLIEGNISGLAAPPHCRFTMFPSLKQRPTLALEHDALRPSLPLPLFPCLFVALLVSLNKLQRFLGNSLFKKKKSYHGIFLAQHLSFCWGYGVSMTSMGTYKAYNCVYVCVFTCAHMCLH